MCGTRDSYDVEGPPDIVDLPRDPFAVHTYYLCEVGREQAVFFLWRPTLRDPDDDMVLELAVAAGCEAVVTYNVRDFRGTDRFGIEVWTPVDLLRKVGLLS